MMVANVATRLWANGLGLDMPTWRDGRRLAR